MSGNWREDIEYDLQRWNSQFEGGLTDTRPLVHALRQRLGQRFEPDLVQGLDGDNIRFLMVGKEDDDVLLVAFEPPDITTVAFLGSLAGGEYEETVIGARGVPKVRGVFTHPRLKGGSASVTVPPRLSPERRFQNGKEDAVERAEAMLERLQRWATLPPPR